MLLNPIQYSSNIDLSRMLAGYKPNCHQKCLEDLLPRFLVSGTLYKLEIKTKIMTKNIYDLPTFEMFSLFCMSVCGTEQWSIKLIKPDRSVCFEFF